MKWQPPLNLMRSCGPVLIGKDEEEEEKEKEGEGRGGCRRRLGNPTSSLCVMVIRQGPRFINREWSGVRGLR